MASFEPPTPKKAAIIWTAASMLDSESLHPQRCYEIKPKRSWPRKTCQATKPCDGSETSAWRAALELPELAQGRQQGRERRSRHHHRHRGNRKNRPQPLTELTASRSPIRCSDVILRRSRL